MLYLRATPADIEIVAELEDVGRHRPIHSWILFAREKPSVAITTMNCSPSPPRVARWMPINSGFERQAIQRTGHPVATLVQHVRVDHRRAHIAVAQQFLHRANVVASLQQMRGEGMATMSLET